MPLLLFITAVRRNLNQQDLVEHLLAENQVRKEKPGKKRILLTGDRGRVVHFNTVEHPSAPWTIPNRYGSLRLDLTKADTDAHPRHRCWRSALRVALVSAKIEAQGAGNLKRITRRMEFAAAGESEYL